MMRILSTVLLAGCVSNVEVSRDDDRMAEVEQRLDQNQHLVVRVLAPHGIEIAVREPVPGELVITQIGHIGVAPLELPTDPEAAFHALLPDEDVPEVLALAIARSHGATETRALDPVTLEVASDDLRSFPRSSFQCWVKNQVRCVIDFYGNYSDSDFYTVANQQFNAVWATDGKAGDYIHNRIIRFTNPSDTRTYTTYDYDTYDGWWRVFQIQGTFGVSNFLYPVVDIPKFHYSTARWQ